jgi:putative flavoprotein involved in K+ transport
VTQSHTARARTADVVVVGAGQAGLVMSRLLSQAGREHVVLDRRSTLGGGWQDRWDTFCLVTPNFLTSLPGDDYTGPEPEGFMPRDEVIARFRRYAEVIAAPVEMQTDVTRLRRREDGRSGFELTTSQGPLTAREVVVAGGPFPVPHIPPVASGLDPSILQLHSHHYRNADDLPPGGVLVIGSGQSGVQLTEELLAAGRSVVLSVGHCGRTLRRYRGRDSFWWIHEIAVRGAAIGTPLPSVAATADPRARFVCNPHVSGHAGGHDTNLRQMAADGVRLAGRLEAADGRRVRFAPDLSANLRFADTFFGERLQPLFDAYIERAGVAAPPSVVPQFDYDPPEIAELDLAAEGISSVLWTSGYRADFGWIDLPILDEMGLPRQVGGVSDVPGLTFLGLPWMVDMASANLAGVARDAEALVARM